MVRQSTDNWRTRWYDKYQKYSVGIWWTDEHSHLYGWQFLIKQFRDEYDHNFKNYLYSSSPG